ncbi:MAG: WYL domain-containing protein [Oscillospiraceae bacterium]|nr:WYL domain-containing protein [Oscillospiraceae bacterium]
MPRSADQKKKILVLLRYLQRYSDEEHPVTMQQLLEELARNGIPAERKSVYDDLRVLEEMGVDLLVKRGRAPGYAIGQRDFELAELKLLVDSIQSSKFITEGKTMALIGKLESLVSIYDARKLQRQVYVRGRVKSMNESVYYNVDAISDAIGRDRAIRFRYYEISVTKQKRYRRGGAYYQLSPYALIWDDENYYLLAWDAEEERFKHFRVDKMASIQTLEEPRQGKEAFRAKDMSVYSQQVFGMFAGEPVPVRMRFAAHLAGAVVDRFGKDTILAPDGPDAFTFTAKVAVSPQFFAWLFGFGTEAEILSPPAVRQAARDQARDIAALYASEDGQI